MTRREMIRRLHRASAMIEASRAPFAEGTGIRRMFTEVLEGVDEAAEILGKTAKLLGGDGDDLACSACGAVFGIGDNEVDRFDYCPVCGTPMKEVGE
jgi:hypothetical protein